MDNHLPLNAIMLIEQFCLKHNLETYDPYDIWKTKVGLSVKDFYNRKPAVAIFPASVLVLFDHLLNNRSRYGYRVQEYPIVRGLASQILLNVYKSYKKDIYLTYAREHLDWLVNNSCKGYSGNAWGIGFTWPVSENIAYDSNTPLATHTPYVLEAFNQYTKITGDMRYMSYIESCYKFYENDIKILFETPKSIATSYGPTRDRIVTNSISYTLFAYSIFIDYFPKDEVYICEKIYKLYNFIKETQSDNGSWHYAPFDDDSFIDCFHSCIVLKNIIKTQKRLNNLDNFEQVVGLGYNYIVSAFYDKNKNLFKRFSKTNKINITKFDLYDNAEFLNLASLMGDKNRVTSLNTKINEVFIKNNHIYSSQNFFGSLINKNTLRWAVMPYLYSLSINMEESFKDPFSTSQSII